MTIFLKGEKILKNKYVQNVYAMLLRRGLAPKYAHPGIYCIKVNDQIVYIGKSHNMLERISEHYVGIKRNSELKYRILSEVQRKGRAIEFDVLYYAKGINYWGIVEEIGQKEGEYIRALRPLLNTQIPKADNWRKWDVQQVNAPQVLKLHLGEE